MRQIGMQRRRRGWRRAAAVAALAAGGLLANPVGATQYDLVVLDRTAGEATAVDAGRVVGYDSTFTPTLWTNGGTVVRHLSQPSGFLSVAAFGIAGDQMVGWGTYSDHNPRALLWASPTASAIDLSTGGAGLSEALATDGAQQVGMARGAAAVWSGTPQSYVNIGPSNYSFSEATSAWNGIQVGFGGQLPSPDALLWHGTAQSVVVLRTGAEALGISRGQLVGWAGNGATNQAAMWTGETAASYVNLAPAGTTASELMATDGVLQVGDVSLTVGSFGQLPPDHHPGFWHGTPGSFQMLPLPAGDNYGYATGIDGEGNISGFVGMGENGGGAGIIPVVWLLRHLAGDANFDGSVGFDDLITLDELKVTRTLNSDEP